MEQGYRSWDERHEIVRSIIASSNPRSLDEFDLTFEEENYFRSRADKLVARLAKQSSEFRSYYELPVAKPFQRVVMMSGVTLFVALIFALYLWWSASAEQRPVALIATCLTAGVVALGWGVMGWISHRNTVRQNTNTILFARFSQAPFGDALHRFHKEFGWADGGLVSTERIRALNATKDEEKMKAAASAIYILNYYESIASGVLHGDLDDKIVGDNVRGLICAYFDKCRPHIQQSNRQNSQTFENMIKLRMHYRRP